MDDLFDEEAGTREAILAAAYRALSADGYANLTIERIGEEFEKSPSLVYHHYDGKDDLLLDLLRYMLDRYEQRPREEAPAPTEPRARLECFVESVLAPSVEDDHRQFVRAVMELRAQAIHDEEYRRHFTRSTDVFQSSLERTIRDGIEDGVFREVDPEAVAATLQTLVLGALYRRSTTDGDAWLADAREEVERYLDQRLYDD